MCMRGRNSADLAGEMATKKKSKSDNTFGSRKLHSFFKTDQSRKRSLDQEDENTPPVTKRPSPPATLVSTPSPEPALSLSQEQRVQMEGRKLEAEAKRVAKRFGAEQLGLSWFKALREEFKKPYVQQLVDFLTQERAKAKVYPPANQVFSWTLSCTIHEVKVVILGQDPYHGFGQAHGMCFSVQLGVPTPPSLLNMYKELESDVEGFQRPAHGYLMGWARQGVLLLNACLTVRHKEPKSHADKGWEKITDAVVHWLNEHRKGLVFLLWGKDAQKKGHFINTQKHCVLKSVHPSPLSAHRGFMGCRHFSQANEALKRMGKPEIDWNYLPEK